MTRLLQFPLWSTLRTYDRAHLRDDLMAGVTTAVMLVPQAMAYAMLAGLEPAIGLYAATVPVLLFALLGTSRQLSVGPVAMVSLLVAAGIAPLVPDADPVAWATLAAVLALLVGGMQLAMGVLRLGLLVRFLSHPVVVGFTSAAAILIGLSQLKHVLGLSLPRSHHAMEVVLATARQIGDTHLPTLAVGALSVVALVGLKRWSPRFPRHLLVVVLASVGVAWLGLPGVATVGFVPSGLPAPTLPSVGVDQVVGLLPMAVTIALVGFMESISVAQAFARKEGYAIDPDQELKALGIANLGAGLFHGYPVTGGFSRTAVNAQAGARTTVAGLVTAAGVVGALLFLTPAFALLPKAALAAIILTAVASLIDLPEARRLWNTSRADFTLMGLTFAATLVLGIEQGIVVGVVGSVGWFVWRSSRPHIAVLGRVPGTDHYRNIERYPDAEQLPGVLACRVDGPLFFANALFLKEALARLELDLEDPLRAVVLDAEAIGSIDVAGAEALLDIAEGLERRGVALWLAGVRGPVRDVLQSTGVLDRVGPTRAVERTALAMRHLEAA